MAAKAKMMAEQRTVVARRGDFGGEAVVVCAAAGVTPIMPKTRTSPANAKGCFAKRDFG